MSHEYCVRCRCGESSADYPVASEVLVGAVRESSILKLIRKTGWGTDLNDLWFRHSEVCGLAAFLCTHFDHGGFEVVGEYKSDVPVPCRPEMEAGAYQAVCLARIREEIADIEDKLSSLKNLSE